MTQGAENRFRIVFAKLAEAPKEQSASTPKSTQSEATPFEIDEIEQLRRIALEIAEPDQISYTTT